MDQRQAFEDYLFEKPLAVSIAHLLNEKKDEGMTATELAEVLHLSVPTLYRLTLEMHQMRLIKNERKGRKNIFKISEEFQNLLPSLSDTLKKLTNNNNNSNINLQHNNSKFDQVSMAKSLLEEYNLPLSPRIAETMIISALKQKISSDLPADIAHKNVKPINTILKEKSRFDIYLGNKKRYVAIEIKIIETVRGLRESIGNIALLDLKNNDKKFAGIIVAYLISSMGGKFYISEEEVSEAINALSSQNNKIFAIISKADRYQIIDSSFLDNFAFRIVEKVKNEVILKNAK
jgi:DNA-binding MarR family transcriptional regulator